MEFTSVSEIEDKYEIVFGDILNKYNSDIIKIFNGHMIYDENVEDSMLMFIFASYFCNVLKDKEKGIKLYEMAAEKGNHNAMNTLGIIYCRTQNHSKSLEYYNKSLENNNINARNNLGCLYYYQLNNREMGVTYWKQDLEINPNFFGSNINLGKHYYLYEHNKKLAFEHFQIGFTNNLKSSLIILSGIIPNNKHLFFILRELNIDNILIKNKIKELMKDNSVSRFNHKLNFYESLKYNKECIICAEETLSIEIGCGHETCPYCFLKLNKCSLCKYPINI